MADQEKPKIRWIKSPDGVAEIYTNTSHVTWSLDDLRIRLGQLVDSPEAKGLTGPDFVAAIEERAAVTFTWRNAKVLRDQLTALIDAYERENGPINVDIKLIPAPI